ncbi:MAG: dTDP-4-dehydrorhamnose reductase [Lachnospiraceae bacterium]|nr:dTDP-4-dehydrorhamnose reductase [Lachnospiraceae bacterium]
MIDNEKKYVLVTGATGQLGSDIVKELTKREIHTIGIGSRDLDITDSEAVFNFFNSFKFSHVIHAAAYTKVDKAQDERDLNYEINVRGTENIVSGCYKYSIPMTYFSTDYVFGGDGDRPYREDDEKNPLCEYANAKLQGEELVKKLNEYFIFRISWVFGKNGTNFINTMLKLSETKKELRVVSDQIGSPSYTVDIAKEVVDVIKSKKYGIYHLTNEGYVSWADFARKIFDMTKKDVKVYDITTEEYNAKAKRPKNSRLSKEKLYSEGFSKMPTWDDALNRYLKEINVI